jgi:hypothetical protein
LALFTMAANRLLEPLSKLACHEHWVPNASTCPRRTPSHWISCTSPSTSWTPTSRRIERELFFRTADLFRADVDLIFWDTTTVYFEVDEEDVVAETRRGTTLPPLRKRGHSKESRDETPQAIVGLALTRDGLPVRSWVFPGNTMDATTVAQVKEELRGWKLGRAIFVGDAAWTPRRTGTSSPKGSATTFWRCRSASSRRSRRTSWPGPGAFTG